MSVYGYSEPAHFSMTCFRCDQALERITLDQTTTSPHHIERKGDRTSQLRETVEDLLHRLVGGTTKRIDCAGWLTPAGRDRVALWKCVRWTSGT